MASTRFTNKQIDRGVTVKFRGKALIDANMASTFVDDFLATVNEAINRSVREESQNMARDIRRSIRNQSLRFRRLKPSYQKEKKRSGFGDRIGIRSESMVNFIRFFQVNRKKYFVGIRRRGKRGDRKTTASIPQYARIFEYGSSKQPARPFLRPGLRRARPKYLNKLVLNTRLALIDISTRWGARNG